jgi:ribose 5-phosphate isomerase A
MSTTEQEKARAAAAAVERVRDGMAVGLGTGSTAAHAVRLLGERMRDGLRIVGVPTSSATQRLAVEAGIPLVTLDERPRLDVTIDGADEVDARLDLVKGGGGALLREKVVAYASERVVIVVDGSKVKTRLGAFPLPVEIIPFARSVVEGAVRDLKGAPSLRVRDGAPLRTDEGHWILDCAFGSIADTADLSRALHEIPGVVEHGLFLGMADEVIVARAGSVEVMRRPP